MVKVERDQGQFLGDGSFGEVLPSHNGHGRGEDASILVDATVVAVIAQNPQHVEPSDGYTEEQRRFLETEEGHKLVQRLRAELEADLDRQVQALVAQILSHTRHDLKTPMTSLATSAYLLRRMIERLSERPSDDVVKDKLFHHLAVIEASVKTLSEAVTLGTTDIYHVKLERISSGQVLNHLVNRYRPSGLLSDKVSLVWLFPDQDIQFIGDGEKLKSMLHILIDNALKFTPRGTIHVQLSLSEDKILIQVADTGCGIPQHKLETIFEYGVSLSDEETPALQGSPPSSGRGLYYVKQFCEVLGGDVRVESTHGYRTMFTITLPRHSEADLPA